MHDCFIVSLIHLSSFVSLSGSMQGIPPNAGAGLVHVRVRRVCVLSPQVSEQPQFAQSEMPPLTEMKNENEFEVSFPVEGIIGLSV